ncbi:gamma-glutamylcyclotransferase family protein [Aliihoeflea sp. 40Bstr573]|uniref:gamma-glutamylcyclotransferase family protein n=1 Tax=Aliihoeflea sp. 40Bstr573 TaxID=2696467 RepID=UPI0020957D08|nr:gamma-glutamylcyclotransferase family protein [Aliihoeflea sp. 40Bstr573]MCO6385573.1 gamma-glutamylcyclotransferase [Aliihoeflea sp. 40Bstr573]
MSGSPVDRHAAPVEGLVAYFGYGSLVCRLTHRTEIVAAYPARLKGWRRHWRPRPDMPGFPAALLTVRPQDKAGCDGLLVIDRAENLADVDAREARYDRVEINRASIDCAARFDGIPIYLYVAETQVPAHPAPPMILQSYLDAVMHGFQAEHGDDGLMRFLDETDGCEIGLHADRDQPLYPRALAHDDARAAAFDRLLAPYLVAPSAKQV